MIRNSETKDKKIRIPEETEKNRENLIKIFVIILNNYKKIVYYDNSGKFL